MNSGTWRYAGGNGDGDGEDTPAGQLVKHLRLRCCAVWWIAVLCLLQGQPVVAGVRLGDRAGTVRERIGEPDRRQRSLGLDFWDYDRRGLSLIWDLDRPGGELRVIVLKTFDAGAIEGIRVGDRQALLRPRWGVPARTRQEGRFVDFARADWVQTVELRDGRVVEITLTAR